MKDSIEIDMTEKKFGDLQSLFAEVNADDSLLYDEIRRLSHLSDHVGVLEITEKRKEDQDRYMVRLGDILGVKIVRSDK